MENASKALLIAGAILIAIVLISLGVMILGQGQDMAKDADTSDVQVTSFNGQFEQYFGSSVNAGNVRSLISKVEQNNRTNASDTTKQITLAGVTARGDVHSGSLYTVEATGYTSAGLISDISITENSSN